MAEKIFGPVLTIFVYEDQDLDKALAICDAGSPYGLKCIARTRPGGANVPTRLPRSP